MPPLHNAVFGSTFRLRSGAAKTCAAFPFLTSRLALYSSPRPLYHCCNHPCGFFKKENGLCSRRPSYIERMPPFAMPDPDAMAAGQSRPAWMNMAPAKA